MAGIKWGRVGDGAGVYPGRDVGGGTGRGCVKRRRDIKWVEGTACLVDKRLGGVSKVDWDL